MGFEAVRFFASLGMDAFDVDDGIRAAFFEVTLHKQRFSVNNPHPPELLLPKLFKSELFEGYPIEEL